MELPNGNKDIKRVLSGALLRVEPSVIVTMLVTGAFLSGAAGNGIPALRHDWSWPIHRSDVLTLFLNSTSGWNPSGFGSANPLPVHFILGTVLSLLTTIVGPYVALVIESVIIIALLSSGVFTAARALGSSGLAATGVLIFAAFNPWTYTELATGHLHMLLAYAGLTHFTGALLRKGWRDMDAIVALVATSGQLQFFLISSVAVTVASIARRRPLPIFALLALWLPAGVGLIAEHPALSQMLITLPWQETQSIAFADALRLGGYFTNYDKNYLSMSIVALKALVGFALLGALVGWHRSEVRAITTIALLLLLAVTGTKGPIAGLYVWGLEHLRPVAVFRELYDLVGLVAICFAFLILCLGRRSWWLLSCVIVVVGLIASASWFSYPASRYWLNGATLPRAELAAPRNTRYALFPAFQPLTFHGLGSGIDIDAQLRVHNVSPINTYQPAYPEVRALGEFEQNHSIVDLGALSVSTIIERPCYTTDAGSLGLQVTFPLKMGPMRDVRCANTERLIPYIAEVTIAPKAPVVEAIPRLGSGQVFFGDVAGLADPLVPTAWKSYPPIYHFTPGLGIDARKEWTDARLSFTPRPELAQAFGGVLTMSERPMALRAEGAAVLVFVRGRLLNESGRLVAENTRSYVWATLPSRSRALLCYGMCIVAAQANKPVGLSKTAAPVHQTGLRFASPLPWLAYCEIPKGAQGIVRYNVTYDPGWRAFAGTVMLPHLRVDMVANAWILPNRNRPQTLLFVHVPSAWQMLAELAGAATLIVVFRRMFLQALSPSRSGSEPHS